MILVAGHACLDLFPSLTTALPPPGGLIGAGALTFCGGGVVSNTGIALHKLGLPVRLVARIGDDLLGTCLRQVYASHDPRLAEDLVVVPSEPTSYSIVLSPPGEDRRFIHCSGVNATFSRNDLLPRHLAGVTHLHFGYPTVMPSLYADGGESLAAMFAAARSAGLSTSLDLCHPDAAGLRADWKAWFRRVLPWVDLFCPSEDELRVCLGMPEAKVSELIGTSLDLGTTAVVLKRGSSGLVCRTLDTQRWAKKADWSHRSESHPCYAVRVAGTTGSGDATLAGLLAGLYLGKTLGESLSLACAVGACCCEQTDATSGIPHLNQLTQRLTQSWPTLPPP